MNCKLLAILLRWKKPMLLTVTIDLNKSSNASNDFCTSVDMPEYFFILLMIVLIGPLSSVKNANLYKESVLMSLIFNIETIALIA